MKRPKIEDADDDIRSSNSAVDDRLQQNSEAATRAFCDMMFHQPMSLSQDKRNMLQLNLHSLLLRQKHPDF